MTLFTRGERRRRRLDPTSRIALLSLSFLLILSEACSLSSAAAADASRWSPARKTRLFAASPYLAGPTGVGPARNEGEAGSSVDEEEKRVVHTGPNPLHN